MGFIAATDDGSFAVSSIYELNDRPVRANSSELALAALWEYFRVNQFCGFGYYMFYPTKCMREYRSARHKIRNESQAFGVYDAILEELSPKDFLKGSLVETEEGGGLCLIYPVYGPHCQNAVFVVEVQSSIDVNMKELCWNLGAILQQVHVVVAKSDSLRRMEEFSLSPREEEVLKLMSRGGSNRAIAETLGISVYTINAHVRNIMLKLGESDRVSACMAGLTISGVSTS